MSHHDSQAYYLRTGDSWTKIDYKKEAKDWMKPLIAGRQTGLVEIPANWYLDVSGFLQSYLILLLNSKPGLTTTHVHQGLA